MVVEWGRNVVGAGVGQADDVATLMATKNDSAWPKWARTCYREWRSDQMYGPSEGNAAWTGSLEDQTQTSLRK